MLKTLPILWIERKELDRALRVCTIIGTDNLSSQHVVDRSAQTQQTPLVLEASAD